MELISMLVESRKRTLEMVADLNQGAPGSPVSSRNQSSALGHVAWFQDRWILQYLRGLDPVRPDGDALWDDATGAHAARWKRPHPTRTETLAYMQQVLERVVEWLSRDEDHVFASVGYFHWLAAMHEAMRGEALAAARQLLGYPAPALSAERGPRPTIILDYEADARIPGGKFQLGAAAGTLNVFDNEKWAHERQIAPFSIARVPVTNAQFARFIDDGGYTRQELWRPEGWNCRGSAC
jgi:iron(II)-dependent oxidoreductase